MRMRKLIPILLLHLGGTSLSAQNDVQVTTGMGVFSPMSVSGNFTLDGGSMHIDAAAALTFNGTNFVINSGSTTSGTGAVIFNSSTAAQYLNASGIKLPSVTINNPFNVNLSTTAAGVANTLHFADGKLVLNGNNLTVGDGNPGSITGYNEDRYVVTNGTLSATSGFLIRESVGNTNVVFPIGHPTNGYEPAMINNTGTADLIRMRVAPDVYEFLTTGLLQDTRSSNSTWFVEEGTWGGSNASVWLQHNIANEGGFFNAYRLTHFISRYVGYAPNTAGDTISYTNWDNTQLANTQTGVNPGYITTGTSLTGAITSVRTGLTYFGPMAKTVWNPPWMTQPLPVNFLKVWAQWSSDDVAQVNWTVTEDHYADYYRVERILPGETEFKPAGRVQARSINGTVGYSFNDNLPGISGTVLYRIVAVEKNGSTSVSPVVNLMKTQGYGVVLAPNPASDFIEVRISSPDAGEAVTVKVFNAAGALVFNRTNTGTETLRIPVADWSEGVYQVRVQTGSHSSTHKLMVTRRN